ncbi:MAG: aldo/keto reductase [Furfurilactobacillus sp.]|jgi:diketogulonate reductase-like aldo/keto reductase|uniref:aldo/keto reductase n=1 Tax=Furfurilactobacillus sp. TaxID=2767911 RepID=UPI00258647A3|nr:aldo/keto reductase [Furfurilactobacillus sp.]MCH4011998.1 aldo/keto reductase [Furfurilactobacillus sp.]MCH4037890.1 aldo/keto reductase [Furfurilactobacillus sp.]MCH4115473.1 aldo/keto reductase [Furfurilactobacillus sp.]MCI1341316.1 aldo/keto reductase [Furfurilactobacillus sp.]MCI1388094.1 aldo/keto reductase [Furfurilactobacillus sp.]
MDELTLNNGQKIPQLGLGVFLVQDANDLKRSVADALKDGYRHFDTAAIYHNEAWVGEALAESDVKREDLFITSKVWDSNTTYDETMAAFKESLKKLQTDYLDLYLIHWPSEGYTEKWRAMADLYNDGQIKSIGVSNFEKPHLDKLLASAKVKPAVDQIETHPYFQQKELHDYLTSLNIAHEAWGPLGQGKSGVMEDATLKQIADAHKKSVAQVILRWHLQRNIIVIPKSIHAERIAQNIDVFDFKLSDDEMNAIAGIDKNRRGSEDPNDEEWLKKSLSMN